MSRMEMDADTDAPLNRQVKSGLEKKVQEILRTLSRHGIPAMITGGAVRDAMLKREPKDIDLSADAPLGVLCDIFRDQGARTVGQAFPICLVNGVEIAPEQKGTEPFPLPDLARRDFTFNAMACDLDHRKILDPFDGRGDLEKGLVRFTRNPGERIKEDPVRMVRACRFAALISGAVEPGSLKAIQESASLLEKAAPGERLRVEILKAMCLEKPSLFFKWLYSGNLLKYLFPSLDRCVELEGGPYHGETVFEHCLLVGDALPKDRPMLRLAGFLHDAGKFDAAVTKEGRLSFAGHEKEYQNVVDELQRLRFSNREIAFVSSMVQAHMRPLTDESTPRAVRRLLAMLDGFDLDYQDFMRMRIADRRGNLAKPPYTLSEIRDRLALIHREMNSGAVFSMKDLNISGRRISEIIKIPPGPEIGKIKQALFEHVLEYPEDNTPEKLEARCQLL